ncbi:Glutamate decarboxylase [Sesamum angolense]|uniref:Glutamate decarboxylase n=1 Tax=Sesamum angolense TaxID=2727404 RepID=A0AAE1WZK9_9LAMI|nr:Glutamate decarboxylase [Sesamum angolense]
MENCMENARLLKEGITKTGHFEILSKDVGVPLVAFSLKDDSKYTVFQISDSLRRFGWIVPAYTMPPNAEHIAVLRVVIREDFSHSLAERLVSDIEKVVRELDELPPRSSVKTAHVTVDDLHRGKAERPHLKKSISETQRDICSYWRRISDKRRAASAKFWKAVVYALYVIS